MYIQQTNVESVEPCMRTQVAMELVKTEINYMKNLEIIQKYYAKPLKASLDSGKLATFKGIKQNIDHKNFIKF